MNQKLTLSILALSLSGLLLTSCKKGPSTETSKSAKVKSEVLYDENGNKTYSVAYTYTENNVTKAEVIGDDNMYFTFEYNGDKVVKKNYFSGSSTASTEFDKVNYNSDGTISSIEHYTNTGSTETKVSVIDFNYSNGKVSKLVRSQISNGTTHMISQHDFTYTNGNITSEKITDAITPDKPLTITYTYDNKENYYNKLFTQPALIAFELSEEGSSPAFNTNNEISISTSYMGTTSTGNISYTLNNNNYLADIKVDGKTRIKFNY